MRVLELQTWPRRGHFEKFKSFTYPHFNMCANVDLTAFLPYIKQRGISPTVAIVYLIARTANELPEFRQRIHGEQVVEHAVVHPSYTVLIPGDLFSFCTIQYVQEFTAFAANAKQQISYVKEHPTLKDVTGTDNLLFMTAIPWVSFTSFMHPIHLHPIDSVPRFAWGKFFEQGDRLLMPLSVQAHHALMDGLHMGRYYEKYQGYLNSPDLMLGNEWTG
jgi:chloramphenicol O-acetyltransferase type A